MLFNILSLLFLFSSIVLASTNDLVERQTSDGCTVTQKAFEAPDNVRVGEPFRVKFCTGAYFKTSTHKIFFTWGRSNTSVAGHVVLEELEPNINNGYLFNTTVYYTNSKLEGAYYFGVLEEIDDYYVPYSFNWYSKPVNFCPSEQYGGGGNC
ncbi:hypothetical protein CPB86DRAFT_778237 [Serendipita vermifera]|nr:hypothetical protein CPB86DRAFT_778237 [Serendipita vermifera]